jgi:hypothetical protein
VGAGIFLQQCAEFSGAHLGIVNGVRDHPVPVMGYAESQADRIGRRLVTLVERALARSV